MMSDSFQTTQLRTLVIQVRKGNEQAINELLQNVCKRTKHLTRKMLRQFPDVKRWEQTEGVMNSALLRLIRALKTVDVDSTKKFFLLAAVQIRRELLDLAKHYRSQRAIAANHKNVSELNISNESDGGFDSPDPNTEEEDLELWIAFHEAVEKLPAKEREVVGLIFYHRWTHQEIADLYNVSTKTVGRWWLSGCEQLHNLLAGRLPNLDE